MLEKRKVEEFNDLEFFKYKGSYECKNFVYVSKKGTIRFSAGFVVENIDRMKDKTHVKLGYSKTNKALTFQFIESKDIDGSFTPMKLSKRTKDNALSSPGTCFIAISLFKANSIDLTAVSGRYKATYESILNYGKFYVIRLEKLNDYPKLSDLGKETNILL
jgi:hypothetical protein